MTRLVLLLAILAVSGVACSNGAEGSPYPTEGPVYSAGALTTFPTTLDGLISEADLIAVVLPTGERSEVWNSNETSVSSRFPATVGEVLQGKAATGDSLLLFAPGGTARDPFSVTESRKPAPGDSVRTTEYVDAPFFRAGYDEVVFLKHVQAPAGSGLDSFYYPLGIFARYSVVNGHVESILGTRFDHQDSGGAKAALEGKSLDWLREQLADVN